MGVVGGGAVYREAVGILSREYGSAVKNSWESVSEGGREEVQKVSGDRVLNAASSSLLLSWLIPNAFIRNGFLSSCSYVYTHLYPQVLPTALLILARHLTPPALRSDLRQRLLALCSNVGLVTEARSFRYTCA